MISFLLLYTYDLVESREILRTLHNIQSYAAEFYMAEFLTLLKVLF